MSKPVSVTQLSAYIKGLFEGDLFLSQICVKGELSNFKAHSSGHCYFTLKDEGAVVSAVMFRGDAGKLQFQPESGMKVILYGRVSLFPKSGQYQIYVSDMQLDGVGDLFATYEQLKDKLHKEGLFDKKYKKPLPKYPKHVALVTSKTGAAVRDMIRVISARYKVCDILVCPVTVQGETAAGTIVEMLRYLNEQKLADVIIAGRGGGSMEDLWCFNEESVARAIFASEIPIISAVGHEPDITISDYVADVRAATPSNGAELAVPDSSELLMLLGEWRNKIYTMERKRIGVYKDRLAHIAQSRMLSKPEAYLNERSMTLSLYEQRLGACMDKLLQQKHSAYGKAAATLDAISPLKVISRGYSLVEHEGKIVKSTADTAVGDELIIRLSDGKIKSKVLETGV